MEENYLEDTLADNSKIIHPDEGEKMELGSGSFTCKVTSNLTNDQLGIYEIVLQPKTIGANLHYHRFMDETFIVTEGTLTVMHGTEMKQLSKGAVVFVPRFTPHGFKNDSDAIVKLMLVFNPSMKREGFFKGLHQILGEDPIDPEKYQKLYNKYDSFPVDSNQLELTKESLPNHNKN
ncbi:cupin domain-containing protein [Muricauda sp. CAU 1633]|uniref:cupin domain-containing protein n=1 Tax=Allomuricauda sp. CAU 1633 TaxID=2816036 RepID=UPI001A902F9E|nr:cupin domain-containing protein [Muricauda sp. CAU 1633]MBO0321914.1 cupin domain-containing protein [Muricauda sp. CAU 1633]